MWSPTKLNYLFYDFSTIYYDFSKIIRKQIGKSQNHIYCSKTMVTVATAIKNHPVDLNGFR